MPRRIGLIVLVALALASFAHAVDFRGVHPSDAALYSGSVFSCKDGSKTNLPLSTVNDDYCDCADGSDEPGTSACSNGRFFCKNLGHVGLSLFSSRVNDGICDCCDGSDEYDGRVTCQDTCFTLGEETRNAKRQEVEAFKKGLVIRQQYVVQALSAREEKQKKIEELKTTLAQKSADKDELQAQVDALTAKAKAAEELLALYKPKETAPLATDQQEEQQQQRTPPGFGLSEEDDGEDEDEDEEEDDEQDSDEEEEDEAEEVEEKPLLDRTEDVIELLEQAEKDVVDMKELRRRLNQAKAEIDTIASNINTEEEYFKLDLGDDAFHGIRDQTFELHTAQYTYKLTPFKDVKQQHTRLGDWHGWLDEEHTKMEFSGGERCWNGPDRKTIVQLICGDANKILSVQEPNKCEYHMEFTTPAACTPQRLALLEQELARLENPGEAVVPPFGNSDII